MKFRIGRVAVEISYPFAAMAALILLLDTRDIAVAGLMAAFIHECGHFLWMIISKTRVKKIHFSISGIHILSEPAQVPGYWNDMALALAGPLSNLITAIALVVAAPHTQFLENLALGNLAMMAINILPVQALDGGSALEALLCVMFPHETAEKIVFVVSLLCLIPLLILGFCFLLASKYNFTLLILAMLLLYNIAVYSKEHRILGAYS